MILNNNRDVRLRDGTKVTVKSARDLLAECRRYGVRPIVKRAAIGGEQEAGFEQSFASLAYSHIQDKAPGLLDYLIGFQLVDRNEENTKAIGIFGFKVGQNWVYAPVFFLNGDLKGHELLYLKAQDSFVPMKENWINYIINKRPHVLGEYEQESPEQLGMQQPDIQQLSQPPVTGKFAAALKPWAKESGVMNKYAQWVTQSPRQRAPDLGERLSLSEFLRQDVRLCKLAMDMQESYPGVKKAFDKFYGSSDTVIRNALLHLRKQASAAVPNVLAGGFTPAASPKRLRDSGILNTKIAAGPPKKVEVITSQLITENRPKLDEKQQEKLLREGYLVEDHRNGEEISTVYNTQIDMSLVNPDDTCVCEVLVKPGTFEKCLVIMHPQGGGRYKDNFCTLVRLDGKKNWANYHSTNVFTRQDTQNVKSDTSAWREWFKGLPDNKSLDRGATYVIVTENAQGSCVFSVTESLGDKNYEVSWEDYCSYDHERSRSAPILNCPIPVGGACDVVCFNEREGSSFRVVNGKLYCPPNAKVIKIHDAPNCRKCSKSEYDCTCDYFRSERRSNRDNPIRPGDLADLQMLLVQKQASDILARTSAGGLSKSGVDSAASRSGLSELKIWSDGNEVVINRNRMSKMAGLFHLICDHGLRETFSKKLLKEAELGTARRWYIKYANPMLLGPYGTGEGGPSMPMMGMEPQMGMDGAPDTARGSGTIRSSSRHGLRSQCRSGSRSNAEC